MKKNNQLVKVFSGTEGSVYFLKGELANRGIFSIVRNDYQSGITAGFFGGVTSDIDLYIQEADLQKAQPVLEAIS
ncbi:MAG TPA: DUF2007 domain-containing protein [Sunxiuqinia sp.]|nr:DUF2007 domain-containing protein [Sunxiuqinia sp.]